MKRIAEKIVDVKPDEIRALWLGFVFNFAVLGGYYVIRPIRDEIGAASGLENSSWMFTAVLVTMLVANGLFSAIVVRMSRRKFTRSLIASSSRISSSFTCSCVCSRPDNKHGSAAFSQLSVVIPSEVEGCDSSQFRYNRLRYLREEKKKTIPSASTRGVYDYNRPGGMDRHGNGCR